MTLCHLMEQLQTKQGNPLVILFSRFSLYYAFLIFQTNSIMEQENINYLHNTKEKLMSVTWENIGLAHGAATAYNRESLEIFCFSLFY